jgi:prepilin peptidase CpaA
MSMGLVLAAAAAATVAVITDLRRRRIPNWLTGATLATGLLLNLWLGGLAGGLSAIEGAALGFLLLIPFYALRAMGAGDVKLLAALGALLGPHDLVSVAVYGAVVGGLMSLVVMVRAGFVGRALRQLVVLGQVPSLRTGLTAPYAVAIAGGVYLTQLLPPVLR